MRKKNNKIKESIYDYYKNYHKLNECAPSVYDVASNFGISKSTAHSYIKLLIDEGKLEVLKSKGCKPIEKSSCANISIPIIGYVSCGIPLSAEENVEGFMNLPNWLFKTGNEYYCLIANGDSMINAGISNGDILLIRRQLKANNGEIVVVLTQDCENTLKRLLIDSKSGEYILHAENPKYDDIHCSTITIQGVVEKVIKNI